MVALLETGIEKLPGSPMPPPFPEEDHPLPARLVRPLDRVPDRLRIHAAVRHEVDRQSPEGPLKARLHRRRGGDTENHGEEDDTTGERSLLYLDTLYLVTVSVAVVEIDRIDEGQVGSKVTYAE